MDSGIGGFALSLALGGGPVATLIVLFALLNRRDRCQARLLSLVARQLPGEALRSDIVIEARCPMLARGGGVVRVDIRDDGGELHQVIERLRQTLPPAVRLVVEGVPHPDHAVDLLRDTAFSEPRGA
jgi:hypothetical protein